MQASATEFGDLIQSIQTLQADDTFRARLDPQQWRTLAGYMTRHDMRAGDLLIRQGDNDRAMYLIGAGTFQVYVQGAAPGTSKVALLRAGAICGEPSLFSDGQRMATVEAMTAATIWALRLPRFEELAQRVPAVALEVVRAAASVMASRMRANMTKQIPMA